MIKVADNLSLPVDLVTQTVAIIAKRRAGKSYTARRVAEQLFKAHQQIVIVDPKGDTWGIRSSADGKSPGLPVVILGGEHGDVGLESNSGEVVAKLVVEEQVSVLLDLSFFRKSEVAQFMAIFLETLYRMKAKEQFRTPVMLVIDEADAIAPQKPFKGEERMLGAAEDIVRRGGQRGIGCLLVTQRSAVLNKNVLTQSQIVVALRTIAPQDIAALDAWIEVHGSEEERKTLLDSIASLPTGDAWFWSPGWPSERGIFKRVHVLPIETFDSGATPKPGETRIQPKNLADVDLEKLKHQMAATIERSKADDPRELRRRIGELEKQLRERPELKPEIETVPMLTEKEWGILNAAMSAWNEAAERIEKTNDALTSVINRVVVALGDAERKVRVVGAKNFSSPLKIVPMRITSKAPAKYDASLPRKRSNGAALSPAKQKILNGLAFLQGIGVAPADKTQLALMVGVSPTSGGYFNNLGSLRSEGYIDYPSGGTVSLTGAGAAVADTDGVPTTTAELHSAIRAKLPPAKWKILEALIHAYPGSVPKDELAECIGVSPTSGGYFNNLGSLRSLGLISYPAPSTAVAQPVLFLER